MNSRDVTEREAAAAELSAARDAAMEAYATEVPVPRVDESRDPHPDERRDRV